MLPAPPAAAAEEASPADLLRMVSLAESCALPDLSARCVALLSDKLREEGEPWEVGASQQEITHL